MMNSFKAECDGVIAVVSDPIKGQFITSRNNNINCNKTKHYPIEL